MTLSDREKLSGRPIPGGDHLTQKSLWDDLWSRPRARSRVRPDWYPDRRFVELFDSLEVGSARASVLEVGCAASVWLPHFAITYKADVWGLDYSEEGCRMADEMLRTHGATGTILCRDLFVQNEDLLGRFDVTLSLGLIEHFSDTGSVVRTIGSFVRTGGIIVSVVPNMVGAMGWAQWLVDRTVYGQHQGITPGALAAAHVRNGFATIRSGYFGSYDPAVVNEGSLAPLPRLILRAARVMTRSVGWRAFRKLRWHPESRLLSPYVLYVGRRMPAHVGQA